jgi:hypothetical protein
MPFCSSTKEESLQICNTSKDTIVLASSKAQSTINNDHVNSSDAPAVTHNNPVNLNISNITLPIWKLKLIFAQIYLMI